MKIVLDDLIEKTKFWWREEVGEGKDIAILMKAYMEEKGIKEEDIEVE
jgi:hypothetical protein